ncbi:MAG: hypothetical protein JF614_29250 [Acidobacteria bacterium]|nr:hypothetical protein [Acidobacteriota bacterium]
MKRTGLFIVLTLCFCTAAAWAQTPVPMDKAQFLASLGTPVPMAASSSRAPHGRKPIQTKSTCTVNLTCDVGAYHISCTSPNGNCSAGPTWVTCDGNTTTCPVCSETAECCDGSSFSCVGWSSCDSTLRSVTCDGHTHGYCPPLRNCG